jgi:hypothetical protein
MVAHPASPHGVSGSATLLFTGVFAIGIYATLRIMPIASSGPLRDFALKRNNDLREEDRLERNRRASGCHS